MEFLYLPLLSAILVTTIFIPITFYILYRQLITFIKEEQKIESDRIQKEFGDIVMNHFDDYLKKLLPDDMKVKEEVSQKISTITSEVMQETQAKLEKTVDAQLQKIDTDVSSQIAQIQTSMKQAEVELSSKYKKAMEEHHQKQMEQFDDQVKELIHSAVGDIIQRELNVEEHTKILKMQLNEAREYYER